MRRILDSGIAALRNFAFTARKNSHAIVGLLPKSYASIAAFSQAHPQETLSSVHLVSCKQTTSGCTASSHLVR